MVRRNRLKASRIPSALRHLSQQTTDSTHNTAHSSSHEGTTSVSFNIMQEITVDNLTEDNDKLEREPIASRDQLDPSETRKQVEQLTAKVKRLKAKLVVAKKEHPKSTTEMEKRIQQLEEENNRLNKDLRVAKEKPKTALKITKKIEKLKEKKVSLKKEVAFLRQMEMDMQKEFKSADQDGVSKDMAKVLKRYYKMEVQFGQMEKRIKKNMEALHTENEKRIKERLDECLKDNEKRMQEHEEKVQGQADHILPSARHIEQAVQKAVDAHAVVLGVTINEQGYFA
jgi:chromosome segregation ATPase